MVSIKVPAFGLIIALIVGMFLGYFAMPEKEVVLTSTIPVTTTLTSVTTTTWTKTLTSRFTTTRTVRETVTTTITHEESSKGAQVTTTTSATQTASQSVGNYDLCTFSDYSGTSQVKLEVLKVVRGESAKDAKYANMFNKKAPDGYEYILVNVKVALLNGERFSVNPLFDFKMESKGRLVRPELIVYPKNMPMLESSELLLGGSTSGWLAFIIPAGAPARLHLEPLMKESLVGCWVDLGS